MLEALKTANPHIPLHAVTDAAFAPYGRVLTGETDALFAALRETEIPAEGNCYVASDPALERVDVIHAWQHTVYGDMAVQAGYCNGNGDTLNAMEYHKGSEVNFSDTGLVLLLALPEDLKDGKLQSADVKGFYLPPRVAAEIHPRVLHFAPCRVSKDGFRCLVVLPAGTNAPLQSVDTSAPGEEALLWMTNKWMTCHPESPQARKGAFIGIEGENLQVKLP